MADYPQAGNGEADQAAYSLFCLKEVVFENGSVWSNRDYDHFSRLMQAGKQTFILYRTIIHTHIICRQIKIYNVPNLRKGK